jgi:hypothetical protein
VIHNQNKQEVCKISKDSNQSLPLLLNAACGEEANINFIVFGLTRQGMNL